MQGGETDQNCKQTTTKKQNAINPSTKERGGIKKLCRK
jgi:hypothetical protein